MLSCASVWLPDDKHLITLTIIRVFFMPEWFYIVLCFFSPLSQVNASNKLRVKGTWVPWLSSSSWSESQEPRANRSFQCLPPTHRCNHSGRGDQNCAQGNLAGRGCHRVKHKNDVSELIEKCKQKNPAWVSLWGSTQQLLYNTLRLIPMFCWGSGYVRIQVRIATSCQLVTRSTVRLRKGRKGVLKRCLRLWWHPLHGLRSWLLCKPWWMLAVQRLQHSNDLAGRCRCFWNSRWSFCSLHVVPRRRHWRSWISRRAAGCSVVSFLCGNDRNCKLVAASSFQLAVCVWDFGVAVHHAYPEVGFSWKRSRSAPVLLQTCQLWAVLSALSTSQGIEGGERMRSLADWEVKLPELPVIEGLSFSLVDLQGQGCRCLCGKALAMEKDRSSDSCQIKVVPALCRWWFTKFWIAK